MSQIEIGSVIGPYRVDSLLGVGGMAQVWRAWHQDLHRPEALKVLPPQLAFDRAFVARFLNEARTAGRLQHANIAAIHAVSAADAPQPYFAMELLDGGDLADQLEARGRFEVGEALPILEQIGSALDYAHGQGFIHRDIKPANIMLTSGARVKVVDFGIARAQEEQGGTRMTQAGMILGTPAYMSPEQGGSGAPVGPRSDLYSLGVIAYEMLCGQPPFHESAQTSSIAVIMEHIRSPPPDPRALNPDLPVAVAAALLAMLAKNPDERPDSASAFLEMLRGQRAATTPTQPQFAPPNPASPYAASPYAPVGAPTKAPGKSKNLLPILLGVGLLVGVGLVGFSLGDRGNSGTVVVEIPTATESDAPTSGGDEGLTSSELAQSDAAPSAPAQTVGFSESEIRDFVERWRSARENRDGATMSDLYASDASRVDGDRQSIGSFQRILREEEYDQPSVSVEVSDLEVHRRGDDNAIAVFRQHFKGWGRMTERNWESRGAKKMYLERRSGAWKITKDTYNRTHGSRF